MIATIAAGSRESGSRDQMPMSTAADDVHHGFRGADAIPG